MSNTPVIALDAMGGDFGPDVIVPAALRLLKEKPHTRLILVGQKETLLRSFKSLGIEESEHLRIHHASEVVAMDEAPAMALRKKKDSSMRVAINLVQQGEADAVVSAGNTGALMATAKFVFKTLPGIDRPAIMTAMPNTKGYSRMMDLGANVDCSAENLYQFALMGSITVSAVDHIEKPSVGLLNVGSEAMKGNAQVKAAEKLIQNSGLNYYGFVEGDDIYKGTVDVVICDGFVGNISLKTAEGVAKMITDYMKQQFKKNIYSKLAALVAMPILKALKNRFDHRVYNGASLLGLQKIVIKSHGGADAFSFSNAIKVALLEVESDIPQRINKHLESILEEK